MTNAIFKYLLKLYCHFCLLGVLGMEAISMVPLHHDSTKSEPEEGVHHFSLPSNGHNGSGSHLAPAEGSAPYPPLSPNGNHGSGSHLAPAEPEIILLKVEKLLGTHGANGHEFTEALNASTTVLGLDINWNLLNSVADVLSSSPASPEEYRNQSDKALEEELRNFTLRRTPEKDLLEHLEMAEMRPIRKGLYKLKIYFTLAKTRKTKDDWQKTFETLEELERTSTRVLARELKSEDFLEIASVYKRYLDNLWIGFIENPLSGIDTAKVRNLMSKAVGYITCYVLHSHQVDDFLWMQENFYTYLQEIDNHRITGLSSDCIRGPVDVCSGGRSNPLFSQKQYENLLKRLDSDPTPLTARDYYVLALIYEQGGAPYLGSTGHWVNRDVGKAFELYEKAYNKLTEGRTTEGKIVPFKRLPQEYERGIINNIGLIYKETGRYDKFLQDIQSLFGPKGINFDPLIEYNLR